MPKLTTMPFGRSIGHHVPNPERTLAHSSADGHSITFGEWKTREAMLEAYHRQEQKSSHWSNWRPLHERHGGTGRVD